MRLWRSYYDVIVTLFALLSLSGAVGGFEIKPQNQIAEAGRAVLAFLEQPSLGLFSYEKIVYLVLFAISLRLMIYIISNRYRPISILRSDFRLEFLTSDGSDVQVVRTQWLRANRYNVTAYFSNAAANFGGTIPKNKIVGSAYLGNNVFDSALDVAPTPGESKAELEHRFIHELPFSLWFALIPDFTLRLFAGIKPSILPNFIVKRSSTVHYINEHNKNETYFQLTAEKYSHYNIHIKLIFHPSRLPRLRNGELEAARIQLNGVEPIMFSSITQNQYEGSINKMHNESIRVPLHF